MIHQSLLPEEFTRFMIYPVASYVRVCAHVATVAIYTRVQMT